MRTNFIFSEVWIGLRRNLTMTIAVIVTAAIGMALFGTGLLIRNQVSNMKGYWADKISISIYLCKKNDAMPRCKGRGAASEQERNDLKAALEKMPQVEEVKHETSDQAYALFKEQFKNSPTFVEMTKPEDLPESFRVKLRDQKDFKAVQEVAAGRPGVSSVQNQEDVLNTFFELLGKLQGSAIAIAIIQGLAAILLIGNTMRLAAYNRRRETGIMRLVGASNLYIQMPFLLEGVLAGLAGGLIAAVMLVIAKITVFDQLQNYFAFAVRLSWGAVAWNAVLAIVLGVLICAVASFVTLRRYLRV
ncbi:permease-like cell division protein FtsX [Bailinhaonella thermotolerans]|uniref:Cell division protein FtsX n=1 Tax=Bailinhaonella thermotolerans TaxID=1070861 RepID=A0A3A4ASZ8_9ACTN|nr:permease-like cell division protein FtsX [Bailinhaonella thermotolerans]RJL30424.1 ABC transporter permease [Bailinhaonella thermotolerans]